MKEWVVAKRKERLVEFAAQKENPQTTEKQSSQKVSNLIVTMCTSDVFFFFFSFFFSPKKLEFYLANSAFVNVYFTLQVKSDLTKLRAERRQQKKR